MRRKRQATASGNPNACDHENAREPLVKRRRVRKIIAKKSATVPAPGFLKKRRLTSKKIKISKADENRKTILEDGHTGTMSSNGNARPVNLVKAAAARPLTTEEKSARALVCDLNFRGADKVVGVLRKELQKELSPFVLNAAMHHCAGRGLIDCVQLLAKHGAPLNDKVHARSPLQLAASRGLVGVCRELVKLQADCTGAREAVLSLAEFGSYMEKEKSELMALFSI